MIPKPLLSYTSPTFTLLPHSTNSNSILSPFQDVRSIASCEYSNSPRTAALQSVIECGLVSPYSNERKYTLFHPYFGHEVEVFTAFCDPLKRILVKSTLLANKFGCKANKIAMFLLRKKIPVDGLFQATGFQHRDPSRRHGLKSGGYFLTIEACKAFEAHLLKQPNAQSKKAKSFVKESGKSEAESESMSFQVSPLRYNETPKNLTLSVSSSPSNAPQLTPSPQLQTKHISAPSFCDENNGGEDNQKKRFTCLSSLKSSPVLGKRSHLLIVDEMKDKESPSAPIRKRMKDLNDLYAMAEKVRNSMESDLKEALPPKVELSRHISCPEVPNSEAPTMPTMHFSAPSSVVSSPALMNSSLVLATQPSNVYHDALRPFCHYQSSQLRVPPPLLATQGFQPPQLLKRCSQPCQIDTSMCFSNSDVVVAQNSQGCQNEAIAVAIQQQNIFNTVFYNRLNEISQQLTQLSSKVMNQSGQQELNHGSAQLAHIHPMRTNSL